MRRVSHAARPDWAARVEGELGFAFHSPDGQPYWDETAHWEFTSDEIDRLDEAASGLYGLCLEACEHVVATGRVGTLGIRPEVVPAVEWSWRRFRAGTGEQPVYARFDFAWDGTGEPKMLEINASTPTSLYESAVVQWHWLEEFAPEKDQFNGLHEALVARWRRLAPQFANRPVHFTAQDSPEDLGTASYMQAVAMEAGLATKLLGIGEVGWDQERQCFVDPDTDPIEVLWSLYPPEWLIEDEFAPRLIEALMAERLVLLEPLWKLMLTKGILAVLWERHPGHPNLLKATTDPTRFGAGETVVAKPFFGREGDGVEIATLGPDGQPQGEVVGHGRPRFAGAEGWLYQQFAPLRRDAGGHVVLGTWMVGDEAKGLGLREDASPITGNGSRFVPHLFD